MKIVIAPSGFKESLSAEDAARIIAKGIRKVCKDAEIVEMPLGGGDSGTNDGGAGAAQALGVKLLKSNGDDIEQSGAGLNDLAKIDLSNRDERLGKVKIDVVCNIKNILCGEKGVARVFGPQKGASPEQVEEMSDALDKYAEIIRRDVGKDVREIPGGGAAGGMGAGLYALLGAQLHSRFDIIFKYFNLDEALKDTDLVITAEGGINFQTPNGKIPAEVARRAKKYGLPVIAIAGTVNNGWEKNYAVGIDAMFSLLSEPSTLEKAIENAPELLEQCAENVMRRF